MKRTCKPALARTLLALALLASTASVPAEEASDPPPNLGVWRAEVGGLRVIEAVLPGEPIAAAPWPGGGLAVLAIEPSEKSRGADGRTVEIRVGTADTGVRVDDSPLDAEERPRRLYRVTGQATDLEPVARELPPQLDALHADGDTLWLGGDGVLYRLDARGDLDRETLATALESPALEVPGLDLEAMSARGLVANRELWVPDVGVLRHFHRDGTESGSHPLPTTAERRRWRLVLRSPPVTRLEDGTLVVGPELVDSTRARHFLTRPDGETFEAWTRLPRPEDVEQHRYALLDGEPIFLAGTTRADRLGVFEKLELRAFRLKPDRTRAGRQHFFETESETIHWYRFEPLLLDWDADGRQDLVLIQPDGMSPGNLVVELFRARANRFDARPKRSKLDAEAATWHLGEDLDGDGRPDLVVGTGALSIYRGVEHRSRVVEKKPHLSLERSALQGAKVALVEVTETRETTEDRPSFRGRIRVGDFDADGEPDIAVVRRSEGRAVIRLVSLD